MRQINATILPISIATIGVVIVSGMALTSHQTTKRPIHLFKATSSVTQTATSRITSTSGDPPANAPADSTQPSSLSPTHINTSTRSPDTPSSRNQQASQNTPTGTPSAPKPIIAAISATLSDWTDPQPTDSKFGLGCRDTSQCPNGYTAYPTFVQYRYCIWTYSNNSTYQKLYEDWYWSPNTSMQIIPEPLFDCTIANAPPA